jgi:hypothetical protein
MDGFLETVEKIWANSFVQALVYLIIALIAGWIASFIVKKLFKFMKLDSRFDKWGINDGREGTALKFVGRLVFLIVFLLFLPAVLSALGLESVSEPITDFASVFISYIPNIIAALILIFIGVLLGKILAATVSVLLAKTKIDTIGEKLKTDKKSDSSDENEENTENMGSQIKISELIGKIINAAVILIAIVQAVTVLDIEAISTPALSIINAIFGAIPTVILAFAVVSIGVIIANIACGLLSNILVGVNFDGLIKKIVPNSKTGFSLTKLSVNIVRIAIIFFVVAQGVEILKLTLLANVMSVIISYLPMVIKAIIIAVIAYFGADLLESFMNKSMPEAKAAAKILKVIIYVVAGFMILSQLDFARAIVNWAFILTLSALAVAFAIAFGIGGTDFAKKTLNNVNLTKKDKSENNSEESK